VDNITCVMLRVVDAQPVAPEETQIPPFAIGL
jgi:hypothetical protein